MCSEYAVEANNVWKRYGFPTPKFVSRVFAAISRESERTDTLPWALQDISFRLPRGQSLGVIGKNGAGKSTLLKLLAGVSQATEGSCLVQGRVFPMIELQAGTIPDLTGFENIKMLAALAGVTRNFSRSRIDEIIAFSELGDWLDRPVRMYSSGMQARLGISVALHSDPDILLIDEVLSVGDYAFRKKCMDKFELLKLSGDVSIVFVSHNPYQVERLCDQVLLLDGGKLAKIGPASQTLNYFFSGSSDKSTIGKPENGGIQLPDPSHRTGTGCLRITSIELLDENGNSAKSLKTGAPATIRMHYKATDIAKNPNFGVRIIDKQNTCILSYAFTRHMNGQILKGEGLIDLQVDSVPLLEGEYYLQVKAAGEDLYDFIQSAPGLEVTTPPEVQIDVSNLGFFYQEATWQVQ